MLLCADNAASPSAVHDRTRSRTGSIVSRRQNPTSPALSAGGDSSRTFPDLLSIFCSSDVTLQRAHAVQMSMESSDPTLVSRGALSWISCATNMLAVCEGEWFASDTTVPW